MDIVDRAADLLDRAQARMTMATEQAAWRARAAPEIGALEQRLRDLRVQLEQSVSELGKLAFRQWKDSATDQTQAIDVLCCSIDGMNGEYQHLLGELADLKASAAIPPSPSEPGDFDRSATIPPASGLAALGETTNGQDPRAGVGSAIGARACPACLAEVPGDQRYCPSCGMRVE